MNVSRPAVRLLAPVAVAMACAITVTAVFLFGVWISGGLRTSGRYLDWSAVGAVATVVGAGSAVGALATIGYSVHQLSANQRDERASRLPYLRVDVGFDHADARHEGFVPPPTEFAFSPEDFGIEQIPGALQGLRPAFGQRGFGLTLWVTNQQAAALGTAYDIRVDLVVSWLEAKETVNSAVRVRFTYVEPMQTTALRLANVRADVSELVASVISVSYRSLQDSQRLSDRHGATLMYYDGPTKEVRNERTFGFGEAR